MILFALALAWLVGSAAAALGLGSMWPAAALAGAGVSLGALLGGRRGEAFLAGLVFLTALVALSRYEEARPPPQPGGVARFNDGEPVVLRGLIVNEPEETQRSQRFAVRVDAVRTDGGEWQAMAGRVLVTARLLPRYSYGDRLELSARLQTPPRFETFDYREYLARRGVVSVTLYPGIEVLERGGGSALRRALLGIREPMGRALARSLPEPEASLARGIQLGQRSTLPPDLVESFNRAGISHLIAISGLHVMLVAGFVTASLSWLTGRRQATAIAMVLVVVYAAFVGGSPSVMRASAMALVMLGATLVGRPGSALTGVVLAGAVLTAWQPLIIDEVAFQMSFAATVGIVLTAQRLRERLQPRLGFLPEGGSAFLSEQLAVTTAASIAVLPIIAASFGRFSIVTLGANLLAAPAFGLALAAAWLTSMAGLVHEGAGRLAGEVLHLPLAYVVWVGRFTGDLPFAAVTVEDFGLLEVLVAYAVIGLLAMALLGRRPVLQEPLPSPRVRLALGAALVVTLLAGALWLGLVGGSDERLRLVVLDVGQGDSILIETPAGHRILVDGGPSGPRLAQALGRELAPASRRIDLVVLTHAHADHYTGLVEALDRYEVRQVLQPRATGQEGPGFDAWQQALQRRRAPVREAVAGEWIELGDGLRLEVLGPPESSMAGTRDDLNNNSVVLRLVHGEASFLLAGDLEAEGEAVLLESGQAVTAGVLKVGHHGSDGSTTAPFLEAVSPVLAVMSLGAENTFGHPSPTLRLRLAGVPLLSTERNGNVRLKTDGRGLWIDFERGGYEVVPVGAGW